MRDVNNLFRNELRNFETLTGNAIGGGLDRAIIFDSFSDDRFLSVPGFAMMSGGTFEVRANRFELVEGRATGLGNDTVEFRDSVGDDLFFSNSGGTRIQYAGLRFQTTARGFEGSTFSSRLGDDVATIVDADSTTLLRGVGTAAQLTRGERTIEFSALSSISATASDNETPTSTLDNVDFLFELLGNWDLS